MKMKHTVKFNSGKIERYFFNSKAESDKAYNNALSLNNTLHTIKSILIEPVNKPWLRERIDLNNKGE